MKTPEEVLIATFPQWSGYITPREMVEALDAAGYEIRRKVRIADENAGPVLAAVRDLFDAAPDWSASNIIDAVRNAGVVATPKKVYNAIGYMTRKGLLTRTNYGQYTKEPAQSED